MLRYETIEGWAGMSEQGELLKECLKHLTGKLTIAEIGVYKGRGTALWNDILIEHGIDYNYFAIDHFEGSAEHKAWNNVPTYDEAVKNLEGYPVTIMQQTSLGAAKKFKKNSLDIVYIDGSHDYESVMADIKAWFPKTKGIICGDDYNDTWHEVKKAVNDFALENNLTVNKVGASQWFIKK